MARPAPSRSHKLALGVALVATVVVGAWAVFDDGLPSVREALATFSGSDAPAPARWSGAGAAWPAAQGTPVAAVWPSAQPGAGSPSSWATAQPGAGSPPSWATAQPTAGSPSSWATAQPSAGSPPSSWATPPPSAPAAAGTAGTTPRPIVIGATAPHGERGPCASCHAIVTRAGVPVPAIASGATAPHGFRGRCTMCHRVTGTATGMPVAGTAVQAGGRPAAPRTESEWRGLEVRQTSRGVEVAGAEGAASQAGFAAGDVVASINGVQIRDLASFDAATEGGTLARGTVVATRRGQRLAFEVAAPATGAGGATGAGAAGGARGAGGVASPWGAAAAPGRAGF